MILGSLGTCWCRSDAFSTLAARSGSDQGLFKIWFPGGSSYLTPRAGACTVWVHGSFRKLGVPCFGVLIIRILRFRVLYWGPLFSETPTWTLRVNYWLLGYMLCG